MPTPENTQPSCIMGDAEFQALIQEGRRFIDSHGLSFEDGYAGLSIKELSSLYGHVLKAETPIEAFSLLAQRPKDGKDCYYDRLFGVKRTKSVVILLGLDTHVSLKH